MEKRSDNQFYVVGVDAIEHCDILQTIEKFTLWNDAAFRSTGGAGGITLKIRSGRIWVDTLIPLDAGLDEPLVRESILRLPARTNVAFYRRKSGAHIGNHTR